MEQEYLLKLLRNEISKFETTVLKPYCISRALPHCLASLFVREEIENFPESINILLANKVPKYLLYNSKSFLEWYSELDRDFATEVVRDRKELQQIQLTTATSTALKNFIKQKLGTDANVY